METGYEIQIDEEARGDTRFNEQDGASFSHTEAIYKIKQPGPLPGSGYTITKRLAVGQWHQYEIEVSGQETTRFTRSNTDTLRGNPPSIDADSGFYRVADSY